MVICGEVKHILDIGKIMKPYKDIINDNSIIRIFDNNIDPIELMWHRDVCDRTIQVIEGSGWQLQLENKLPVPLNSGGHNYFIPKLEWHRLIKTDNNTDLIVKIFE
jgi:hypothetical protein